MRPLIPLHLCPCIYAPAEPTPTISHLTLSPHPTSWLSDVMYLLTAAFPQVPGAAARWRARRHDVTTLPALTDYHERPRCASTTRRQLAAEPACSRRVTVPTKPGEDGYSRQVGEATTRRVKWAWVAGLSGPVMAYHPWVDAPTPRVHPPCGSSTRSSRQARDRLTGRYWHHFPMSPLAFVLW